MSAYTSMGPRQNVDGRISSDGRRIDWSNGSFWTRGGGGGSSHGLSAEIDGTWYANGDFTKRCHIRGSGSELSLTNEIGQEASGRLEGHTIVAEWPMSPHTSMGPRTRVEGRVSHDGRRIDWSNGTYWSK
jgi:hypothetical protein